MLARLGFGPRYEVAVLASVDDSARQILRTPWRDDSGPAWSRLPIARLRYTRTRPHWTLHWRDCRLKFHRYDLIEPTADITELLAEIERVTSARARGLAPASAAEAPDQPNKGP